MNIYKIENLLLCSIKNPVCALDDEYEFTNAVKYAYDNSVPEKHLL